MARASPREGRNVQLPSLQVAGRPATLTAMAGLKRRAAETTPPVRSRTSVWDGSEGDNASSSATSATTTPRTYALPTWLARRAPGSGGECSAVGERTAAAGEPLGAQQQQQPVFRKQRSLPVDEDVRPQVAYRRQNSLCLQSARVHVGRDKGSLLEPLTSPASRTGSDSSASSFSAHLGPASPRVASGGSILEPDGYDSDDEPKQMTGADVDNEFEKQLGLKWSWES
mmetsp:Transcript_51261/g.166203  ORF Transcript_51261/g.166203 Transcript_51261/m.166203 type:complete len:227 (+) Transcript_51261:101-781(+)